MTKRISVLLLVSILFINKSFAQSGILKGTVLDNQSKQAVPGASIFELNQITNASTSNEKGIFQLILNAGTHTMVCSFIGMISDTFKVVIESGQVTEYNLLLKQKSQELDMVVVSAGKYEQRLEEVTVSMEILKPQLMQQKNTTQINTALEQLPGVTILDEEPQIRGGSGFTFGVGSRVLTLIDGVPILSGDVGRADWSFIPIENIEQIEVIKGAASVLYGSSALSGVINVLTTYPKDKPSTNVTLYSGGYSAPENNAAKWWSGMANFTGLTFSHSQKYGHLDLVFGGMAKYDHNYIGPPELLPNVPQLIDTSISESDVASKNGRLNFNLRYRSKKYEGLSVGVNGNFMLSEENFSLVWLNDSDGIYKAFPMTMTLTKAFQFYVAPFLTYYSKDGLKHDLRTQVFYQDNNNSNNQSNQSTVYYVEYKINKQLSIINGLNFTAGLVMNQTQSKANLFAYNGQPSNKLSNYAIYAQLDKKLWNVLNMSFGARGEYYQLNKTETSLKPILRAGLNLKLTKSTFLRFSYGQGYRYPTIAEKYINTNTGGIDLFSNPDLKPESSWNSEIGVKQGYKIRSFYGYLDLAAFWQEFSNTIEYNYSVGWHPDQPGFKFLNTGDTRVRGADFTWLGEGNLAKNWKLSFIAGYTYIFPQALQPNYVYAVDSGPFPKDFNYISTSTDTTDYLLKYRFKTSAKADVQVFYKSIGAGFSVRYYSFMQNIDKAMYDIDQSAIPTGIQEYRKKHHTGTTVFDARVSYKVGKAFSVAVIVSNLFNLEYSLRPLKIESPRTITLQLSYRI